MKAFDSEIHALTAEIKHHLKHSYRSNDNKIRNSIKLRDAYKRVNKLPITEISQSVWDEMNELAEQAMIN